MLELKSDPPSFTYEVRACAGNANAHSATSAARAPMNREGNRNVITMLFTPSPFECFRSRALGRQTPRGWQDSLREFVARAQTPWIR